MKKSNGNGYLFTPRQLSKAIKPVFCIIRNIVTIKILSNFAFTDATFALMTAGSVIMPFGSHQKCLFVDFTIYFNWDFTADIFNIAIIKKLF